MPSVLALVRFAKEKIQPTSSTDVAEQFPDATEVGKTSKESVSVEQGQLLRAAKPDQCVLKVKAKPIPEMPTQRQRGILELTHLLPGSWYRACGYGWVADDPHRRRQGSELETTSCDHADIAAEIEMANKRLRFKVLVNHKKWIGRSNGRTERTSLSTWPESFAIG